MIPSPKHVLTASLLLAVSGVTIATASECYEKAPLHTLHRTYQYRDIVEPGLYSVTRQPSLYGWHRRRAAVPGEVTWREEPAVYRTVTSRVRVGGGWSWQPREIHGKEILCRVRLPVRYEMMERRVLLRGARRYAERAPGSFVDVEDRLLLRPYRNIAHFQRPTVRYSRESLAIVPEGYRWKPTRLRPDC